MTSNRAEFLDGFRMVLPILIVPTAFSFIVGAASVQKGLSPLEATLMSMGVFAGGGQMLALEVWHDPRAWLLVMPVPALPGSGEPEPSVATAQVLNGKELSYNNYLDIDAAFELVKEFAEPAAVVIKHTNPCGAATADSMEQAFRDALAGDPQPGGALNAALFYMAAYVFTAAGAFGLLALLERDGDGSVVIERMREALARRLDCDITLNNEVDPAVLGGAVIYAGDQVIDGSLKGRLDRLESSLS